MKSGDGRDERRDIPHDPGGQTLRRSDFNIRYF
jgi:hypothetical protein